jgi:proline iminopeptidase
MRDLYPVIEPYETGRLQVSSLHTLSYELVGKPGGVPAVFLHGGPGAGYQADNRRYFDPDSYQVLLFDQRGSGNSTPHASLEENTTWDLVADIERLREHLGIQRWLVFGGSWGSTLSLAYAISHPERVTALVLRGIFLCRQHEIRWFYQQGVDMLFPDKFEKYASVIPADERHDMLGAYYRRLTSDDEAVRLEAARAWSVWEGSTLKLLEDADTVAHFDEPHTALSLARIECHYFINRCWFESDNWIVENVGRIRHVPAVIVHGRYDVVCPLRNAWDLHGAWQEAALEIIPDAGHSAAEPGIVDALVRATDRFRDAR